MSHTTLIQSQLVAYRLELPPQLGDVHDVFHVPMLKKYTHNPLPVLPYAASYVTYEEKPTEILTKEILMLHNKKALMVKVRWEKHSEEKATWDL